MDAHTAGRPSAADSHSYRAAIPLIVLLVLLVVMVPAGAALQDDFEWFNTTWQHRVGIDIEANEEMEDWPIEHELNVTELFEEAGTDGTFDEDSIRVYEYDEDGNVLYEQPSQFDTVDGFDADTNAVGELVWMLNGTTPVERTVSENFDADGSPYTYTVADADREDFVRLLDIVECTDAAGDDLDCSIVDAETGVVEVEDDDGEIEDGLDESIEYTYEIENVRHFFVYFDTVENGPKEPPQYGSDLAYQIDGDEAWVNTSKYMYRLDSSRGDGTSGIVQAISEIQDVENFDEPGENERTVEYLEYGNETHNFTFDLAGSIDVPVDGPLRLTLEQEGYRTFYDLPGTDENLSVRKTYRFYGGAGFENAGYVVIEHEIINEGDEVVSFISDRQGLRVDLQRTLFDDAPENLADWDQTEPYSWFRGGEGTDSAFETMVGMINLFGSDPVEHIIHALTAGDNVRNIGVETDWVNLQPGQSFEQGSLFSVTGHGSAGQEFTWIREVYREGHLPGVVQHDVETYNASIQGDTDEDVYNRNETVEMDVEVTEDIYDVVDNVTATLDLGGAVGEDVVQLSEEDPGVWTGAYTISDVAETGDWVVNFSAYTEDDVFVTWDEHMFAVTDELVANLTIPEDVEMEGEPMFANLTVENYRQDAMITGAADGITCSYEEVDGSDSGNVHEDNITEFSEESGIYEINWTADDAAEWELICTAEEGGNIGEDTEPFRTEVAKIVPDTTLVPDTYVSDNITMDGGDVFDFVANLTNDEAGTAHSANFSVTVPDGWMVNGTTVMEEECGEVEPGEFCEKPFQVSIPANEEPDPYEVNVTTEWINPDETLNDTRAVLDVTVEENPVVDVVEDLVAGEVAGGFAEEIGVFTVDSIGNVNATNVSATCEEGTVCDEFTVDFDPDNVSEMGVGDSEAFTVEVRVPKDYEPGTYTGEINVSGDDTWDTLGIEVEVTAETTVDTETIPSSTITVENITQTDNETFLMEVNSTNDPDGAWAYAVNQSLALPDGWSTNTSLQECGDLNRSQSCVNPFFVTVPNGTEPTEDLANDYVVTAVTEWRNPDGSETTSEDDLFVDVEENPVQNVPEDEVAGEVPAGGYSVIGNVTLESIGNYRLEDINYTCEEGEACENFSFSFMPAAEDIGEIEPGENESIAINVSVPEQYPADSYAGELNVSSTGGYDIVDLDVEVPITRTWELDTRDDEAGPDGCVSPSDELTVCEPVLENTGNAPINLTISPEEANNTNVSQTWFELALGENQSFQVQFNTSASQEVVHEATYNVSSDNDDALTMWRPMDVTVQPAAAPIIDAEITPEIVQNETVEIFANVTSQTEFDISDARLNVSTPEGVVHSDMPMELVHQDGNFTQWRLFYANETGIADANTTTVGQYDVNLSAEDAIGNDAFVEGNFTVNRFLNATLRTLSESYLQGDRGTIEYRVQDIDGHGVPGVEVNFTIDSDVLFFTMVNDGNPFTTAGDGEDGGYTETLPSFDLNDDFDAGIYTVQAEAEWYDAEQDETLELTENYSFVVREEGLLDVSWDVGDLWQPESNMTMYATVSEAGMLEDADDISLTVYDMHGNVFFSKDASEFQNPVTGVYKTWHEIGEDPDRGMYWAELAVEKDGESTVDYQSFRLVDPQIGGMEFDINISLEQHEVEQGDHLNFNISFINMGPEEGDARVTYWVERNGTTYDHIQETIFTPLNQTLIIPRNAFIFSNQPLGEYTLHAEVEALGDDIYEPAPASRVFHVVEDTTEEPPDPEIIVEEEHETRTLPPDPVPPEPPRINISIADAPSQINLARGQPQHFSVTVANIGEEPLTNVSLSLLNLPPQIPVTITPALGEIDELPVESTETFAVGLDPSADVEPGTYNGTFVASAEEANMHQEVEVQVFESVEERIRAEIERVEGRVAELELEMSRLEDQGIDTADVQAMVDEIRVKIDAADQHLDEGRHGDALQEIQAADNRVAEADQRLERKTVPERREVFELLPMVVGGVLLLALILVVVYMVRVRHVKPWEAVQDRLHDAAVEAKKKKIKEREQLEDEKRKTKRLIELLEAQHEEGIMDDDSYREMKQSAEEKLQRINKNLEDKS